LKLIRIPWPESWRTTEKSAKDSLYRLSFLRWNLNKNLAIKKLNQFAKMYSENLLGYRLLFIYQDITAINFIEVVFSESNFKHLTGVDSIINPNPFFSACLNQKLSPNDFDFSADGTTALKFQVLDKILAIHTTARYIGDYNCQRPRLITDKLVGDYECCLGLQLNKKYYSPNTILKSNISKEVYRPARKILASLRTERFSKEYSELCYLKPNIRISKLDLPDALIDILDQSLLQ